MIAGPSTERVVVTRDAAETRALAAALADAARPGDLISLVGELGAGKTQFAKGFGAGLRITDTIVSPSFVLMAEYRGRLPLFHVDLYRLESVDAGQLGIEEYLDQGVAAVEWAEKSSWWGSPIKVTLGVTGEQERSIVVEVDDVGRAKVWRDFSCKH